MRRSIFPLAQGPCGLMKRCIAPTFPTAVLNAAERRYANALSLMTRSMCGMRQLAKNAAALRSTPAAAIGTLQKISDLGLDGAFFRTAFEPSASLDPGELADVAGAARDLDLVSRVVSS